MISAYGHIPLFDDLFRMLVLSEGQEPENDSKW
jgi:hypothetical protein